MKLKAIAGCILAVVMACSLILGCGKEKPKKITINVKTPTITMFVPYDKDIKGSADFMSKAGKAFAKQYKDAEVTINVIQYDLSKEKENIADCYGTSDAADVLFSDYHSMDVHIYSGNVIPLEDIITDEQKKDIPATFWQQSSVNNKIYMMPYYYRQNVLVYNKDMMRKAGLERFMTDEDVIQSWTLEEWETVLATLRQNLPEGSYPLMMYAKNSLGDTHVMSFIRSRGSSFFAADGSFDLNKPEGIAGLQWIKDCADKGYMPSGAAYLSILDCFELWQNQQLVIHMGNMGGLPEYKHPYGLVNFPAPNGGCNTDFISGFEIFDNGDADKLAVSKEFVKFIYSSEYLDYSIAGIPCSKAVADKYPAELANTRKFIANADKAVNFTDNNPNWLMVRKIFYPYIQKLLHGDLTSAEVAEGLDRDANKIIEEGRANARFHD